MFGPELGIPPEDFAFFGERIWQILTSCSERRLDEYEKIGWWEFIGAEQRSDAYQKLFGIGLTRSLVAAQAKLASTKTIGDMFVQYFFNLAEPDISADRVLNGPTNDVWIDPWLTYLRGRGVSYHLNARVRSIEMDGGVVRGVTVEQDRVGHARSRRTTTCPPCRSRSWPRWSRTRWCAPIRAWPTSSRSAGTRPG